MKTSAAWLIEHAGFGKGFSLPGSRAALSTKHTLALTNTGGATSAELRELARHIQVGVRKASGIFLTPEPLIVGAYPLPVRRDGLQNVEARRAPCGPDGRQDAGDCREHRVDDQQHPRDGDPVEALVLQ